MHTQVHEQIADIDAAAWNGLLADDQPFLRHEFLLALEQTDCLGERHGWLPRHLASYDDDERLIGAVPLYLKDNSYGEFVFDWSWAQAYQRAGLNYYPKLVSAVPYTPANGARLLIADLDRRAAIADSLIDAAYRQAEDLQVSSLHWLFPRTEDMADLQARGLLRRTGCQFHWHNPGYRDFDDFLARFSAAKRKKVKRERRRVQEAGITIDIVDGATASAAQIATAERLYRSTFERKSGWATLSLAFFQQIAQTMGHQLLLFFARDAGRDVACAICFRDRQALYGRHWGCDEHYHSLHFELCYYQGIDYCIREGLTLFEPGAQGEHKISRGFIPTPTWSAHWIAHPEFRAAVADFLQREDRGMQAYMKELQDHLPFKSAELATYCNPQPAPPQPHASSK